MLAAQQSLMGTSQFRGVEPRHPCNVLARLLENPQVSRSAVMHDFLGSGGLRADVIGSGILEVDMPIISDPNTTSNVPS